MKLSENPFAILGASPRDSRSRLTERADEAALIGGAEVDGALESLMQMNKRIAAELRWMPNTEPEAAAAFLNYARQAEAGQRPRLPSLEGLGCPLAQANALEAFFQVWPENLTEYTFGACVSMSRILNQVTAADTQAAINQDRQAGGWEPIADEQALGDLLEARLRELSQVVTSRLERITFESSFQQTVKQLFASPNFDNQGAVGRAVGDLYLIRIHDQEESLRQKILFQAGKREHGGVSFADIRFMLTDADSWCAMAEPLRRVPGPIRQNGDNICRELREAIVQYFNTAQTVEKKMTKTVRTYNGTRTITLTYQSKADAAKNAIEFSNQLMAKFPECETRVQQLKTDVTTLQGIIVQEDAAMRKKLAEAT